MKTEVRISSVLALVCAAACVAQTPLSSEFTYQGQLQAPGLPVISTADFQFALFDAATSGNQIGSTAAKSNVAMTKGAFTVLLDFGSAAFAGDARWLEVTVRSPAGAGGFTTLAPRQLLTATPNSTYSLTTRGIAVDGAGQVGIGVATPNKKLTVAGDMELGTASNDLHHLRLGGGTSDGFLFGSTVGLGDGIHLGYNHYADHINNHTINADRGTSRLSLGYGTIALATGDPGHSPTNRLIVDEEGNVGIGVSFPTARLSVNGEIKASDITSGNLLRNNGQMIVMGGQQHSFDPPHLIWKLGEYGTPVSQDFTVQNPELKMISPVTSDELAGFYRDFDTGNGVMFADDKNFRAPNPANASTDIWYCCPEGPEAAIYVRGTARLTNGRATIELPDHFRNLASEPGMTVQLTPRSSESKGLATLKATLAEVNITELFGGTGNYEFDWRVEAVRKGWEDYKVIRPWLQSEKDPDKAWQNRLRHIEERRAHGKPSPDTNSATPRPQE